MIVLTFTEEQFKAILSDVVRDAIKSSPAQAEAEGHIKGIKGLAEFLHVSHARAQKLKSSGIFPHFQTGRLILFDPAKVREAMTNYSKRDRRAK